MEVSHSLYQLSFGFIWTYYIEFGEEVIRHSNQGILGPPSEPIHGAARNQAGELQWTIAELLTNLHII